MNFRLTRAVRSEGPSEGHQRTPFKNRILLSAPFFGLKDFDSTICRLTMDSDNFSVRGVEAFELYLQKLTGFRFAVATSSCTAALHLAVRIVGVRSGDEVWCPTLTFIASIAPAVSVGAIPRFIDIDPLTWTLGARLLEEELQSAARRGRLPKALITSDLFGNPVDLATITKVCTQYDVAVISDSAASLGSFVRGEHAGLNSLIAAISFNLNKIISTGGGGVLLTNDPSIAQRARKLRAQAREQATDYEHYSIGYNYMLSPFSAKIGLTQLDTLEWRVNRRRHIFDRYVQALSSVPGIAFQAEAEGARANRWLTAISFSRMWRRLDISKLREELWNYGVEVRPLWRPLHLQPVFAGSPVSCVEVAESLAKRGLCLPSSTQMTDAEQDYVVEKLVRILDRNQ